MVGTTLLAAASRTGLLGLPGLIGARAAKAGHCGIQRLECGGDLIGRAALKQPLSGGDGIGKLGLLLIGTVGGIHVLGLDDSVLKGAHVDQCLQSIGDLGARGGNIVDGTVLENFLGIGDSSVELSH